MHPAIRTLRLHRIADAIERDHARFTMTLVTHTCGTPGCIAGYTVAMLSRSLIDPTDRAYGAKAINLAKNFLGLTGTQSRSLFTPHIVYRDGQYFTHHAPDPQDCGYISWTSAVRTLRHFADTGVVNWADPEPPLTHPT